MNKIIKHSDLSQPIYEQLKKMILNRELKPGQKIIQEKIAAELGVSRTPLNKALNRMEQEMMVESIPRRGMYVKDIDLKDVYDVFNVREGLEAVAARLVIERSNKTAIKKLRRIFEPFLTDRKNIDMKKYGAADEQFHVSLISASGNEALNKMYFFRNLHFKIVQMGLVRPPEETLDEHMKIIEALEAGNVDKAVYETSMHIRKSTMLIEKAMREEQNND